MSLTERPAAAALQRPARPVRGAAIAAAGPGSDDPIAMRQLRSLTLAPILSVGVLLLLSILIPSKIESAAPAIAVLGAGVGLPHGAVDHLVPRWLGSGNRADPKSAVVATTWAVGLVALAYALTAAIALIALLAAPTPTLLLFLVLSGAHFGWGEVATSAQRAGRSSPRGAREWSIALAHGLVVVGLLVWSRPGQTSPLLGLLSPTLGDLAGRTRAPGLAVVGLGVGVALLILAGHRRFLEAAELGLLVATFAVAAPLAAFGVYFGAWHAVRHTGRLLDLARTRQPTSTPDQRQWRSAASLLGRSAVIPMLGASLALAGLWFLRDLAPLPAEVSILLALTFPHAAIVWVLDRRAGGRPAVRSKISTRPGTYVRPERIWRMPQRSSSPVRHPLRTRV